MVTGRKPMNVVILKTTHWLVYRTSKMTIHQRWNILRSGPQSKEHLLRGLPTKVRGENVIL